jgi:serine/threonine protein kinase/tetratricopeptide (TPR) repeat protein
MKTSPLLAGRSGFMDILHEGTLVADRFLIEQEAGRGGMGSVYRAIDRSTGRTVALKVLLSFVTGDDEGARRFAREAKLLASLDDPGIVGHVAHGVAANGYPFLAMNWLEGETLAERLMRQRVPVSGALTLLRGAAAALSAAHKRGIVHRDLKPSNIFLCDKRVDKVVLLDFGIARSSSYSSLITRPDCVAGTPNYMAPEQARGDHHLSPAVDIFALGCVFYQCLTGQCPFTAPHLAAVLAKILFAEPPPLRTLRNDLPDVFQSLVDRMLAKDPDARIPHAMALEKALPEFHEPPTMEAVPSPSTTLSVEPLSSAEHKLVSVIIACSPHGGAATSPGDTEPLRTLRDTIVGHGAQAECLVDGSWVVTVEPRRDTAVEQALLAARWALQIKERWPEALVAVATGRAKLEGRLPVGEAMDRAGQLLRRLASHPSEQPLLDDPTAGLIGGRFSIRRVETSVFSLLGEDPSPDTSRRLLGKPTPYVGREHELSLLGSALEQCIDESVACAILVTGAPGMGKSRLRHEFLRRTATRSGELLLLLGRGDPMSRGSAQGLLSQAIRHITGIDAEEPRELRRERFIQRIGAHVPPSTREDVVEFLAEFCGIQPPEHRTPALRAAQEDPRLMRDRITQALLEFLRAECAVQPVLLVMEDLHWGDALTIDLVGEALRALYNQPLFILALARPEIWESYPQLWQRRAQELPLRGLGKRASAALVREVLGRGVPDEVAQRITEQAAGNALYLEELIRAVADGKGDALPDTILAMLQARISSFNLTERGVVLGASVFGQAFWSGGVAALIGNAPDALQRSLDRLMHLEVIERQRESRFPSEMEYRFRHALVRDAAYGLLPGPETGRLHLSAAAYLSRMGEADPLVLAEHYQRGGDAKSAANLYARAAGALVDRHDLEGARRCHEAGMACGASGQALVDLRATEAAIAFWSNDLVRSVAAGSRVLEGLCVGSHAWFRLMGILISASAQLGKQDYLTELFEMLVQAETNERVMPAYSESLSFLCNMSSWTGQRARAASLLARMDSLSERIAEDDWVSRGWIHTSHGYFAYLLEPAPFRAWTAASRGAEAFRTIGHERNRIAPQAFVGLSLFSLGDRAGALEALRDAVTNAERLRETFPIEYARSHLALVLAASPSASERAEARMLALTWVNAGAPNLLQLGLAHTSLARVALSEGDIAAAEEHARKANELLTPFCPYRLFALAELARALLARGRPEESRAVATLGLQEIERLGGAGASAVPLSLTLAEALYACGGEGGDAALLASLEQIRVRAADVPEGPLRDRYLRDVPENARALVLAATRQIDWASGYRAPSGSETP